MEKRREGLTGIFALSAALIITALALWLLWEMIFGREQDAPLKSAVLVSAEEEEYAHG